MLEINTIPINQMTEWRQHIHSFPECGYEVENTFSHRSKNDEKVYACGHNGHSAMLLAATNVIPSQVTIKGDYRCFTPETRHTIKAATAVLGSENVNSSCDPFTISEDFSSMLRVKPGCYALLGNGIESVGGCALHNPHYDFNDQILEKGAAY